MIPPMIRGTSCRLSSNHDARAWLDRATQWPDRRLALWGPAGCGKTHLLRVWAHQAGAMLLAGPDIRAPADLPESGAVAIDNADKVTPDEVFLHVLNTARDRELAVLMAARAPPARWPASLPDLTSRLRAVTAVAIEPPDDELLRALLVRLLADRQMIVPQVLQDRLLRHLPRAPAALREAVADLDRISLGDGKPVTQSLVSRLLLKGAACQDREDSNTDRVGTSENLGHL